MSWFVNARPRRLDSKVVAERNNPFNDEKNILKGKKKTCSRRQKCIDIYGVRH